jgi:hypothetical protein
MARRAAAPDTTMPSARALAGAAMVAWAVLGEDASFSRLKDRLRHQAAEEPLDTVIGTVLAASLLFHRAEHAHNPQCATFWDAVLYVATSLSVGYSAFHPVTAAGKAIAAALQTVGPAMAAAALDAPRGGPADGANGANADLGQQIVSRLDAILAVLRERVPLAPRA